MKQLLPVGSIVLLKGAVKKAAIMGYLQKVSPKDAEAVKADPFRSLKKGYAEAGSPGAGEQGAETETGKGAGMETDPSVVYDYMAVPYPEGFLGKGSIFLFNEESISEVCFRGYDSDESKGFTQLVGMVFDTARKGLE